MQIYQVKKRGVVYRPEKKGRKHPVSAQCEVRLKVVLAASQKKNIEVTKTRAHLNRGKFAHESSVYPPGLSASRQMQVKKNRSNHAGDHHGQHGVYILQKEHTGLHLNTAKFNLFGWSVSLCCHQLWSFEVEKMG